MSDVIRSTDDGFLTSLSKLPGYNPAATQLLTDSYNSYKKAYEAARAATAVSIETIAIENWKESGDDSYAQWDKAQKAIAEQTAKLEALKENAGKLKDKSIAAYKEALKDKSSDRKKVSDAFRKIAVAFRGGIAMAFGMAVPSDVDVVTSVSSFAPKAGNGDGPDPAVVRQWAQDNGIEVSAKGRISADVLAQFEAATSDTADTATE